MGRQVKMYCHCCITHWHCDEHDMMKQPLYCANCTVVDLDKLGDQTFIAIQKARADGYKMIRIISRQITEERYAYWKEHIEPIDKDADIKNDIDGDYICRLINELVAKEKA